MEKQKAKFVYYAEILVITQGENNWSTKMLWSMSKIFLKLKLKNAFLTKITNQTLLLGQQFWKFRSPNFHSIIAKSS